MLGVLKDLWERDGMARSRETSRDADRRPYGMGE